MTTLISTVKKTILIGASVFTMAIAVNETNSYYQEKQFFGDMEVAEATVDKLEKLYGNEVDYFQLKVTEEMKRNANLKLEYSGQFVLLDKAGEIVFNFFNEVGDEIKLDRVDPGLYIIGYRNNGIRNTKA